MGQVALNWCTSHANVIAIPKTDGVARTVENCGASGWRLTPEQKLFMSYACTLNVARAREMSVADSELRLAFDLDAIFGNVSRLADMGLEGFHTLLLDAPRPLRRLYFHWYLFLRQTRLLKDDIGEIERDVSAWFFEDNSPEMLLLRFMKAHVIHRKGNHRKAIEVLSHLLPVPPHDRLTEPHQDFVHSVASSGLGYLQQYVGDFEAAFQNIHGSQVLAERAGFYPSLLRDAERLGELFWATGQYEESLRWHRDEKRREYARREKKLEWLMRSHNNATKVALDNEDLDLARFENQEAMRLYAVHSETIGPLQHEYAKLFLGELLSVSGHHEEGQRALQEVLEDFKKFTQPVARSVRDTRATLLECCLRTGGVDGVFIDQLDALLEESEGEECVVTRLRVLLVRTFLHVSGNDIGTTSERSAFKRIDVRFRAELLNDFLLLLAIVAYLYRAAPGGRTAAGEARLRRRLETLRPVLEASCHPGLYMSLSRQELRQSGLFEPLQDTLKALELD